MAALFTRSSGINGLRYVGPEFQLFHGTLESVVVVIVKLQPELAYLPMP